MIQTCPTSYKLICVGLLMPLLLVGNSLGACAERLPSQTPSLELGNPAPLTVTISSIKPATFRLSMPTYGAIRLITQGEISKLTDIGLYMTAVLSVIERKVTFAAQGWSIENITSGKAATFVLHPGEYDITLAPQFNGGGVNIDLSKYQQTLTLRGELIEELALDAWIPAMNKWFSDIRLNQTFLVRLALAGPEFKLPHERSVNSGIQGRFVLYDALRKGANPSDPELRALDWNYGKPSTIQNKIGTLVDKLYVLVDVNTTQAKLENFEQKYQKLYGNSFWDKLLAKISLLSGVTKDRILVQVPIPCDSEWVVETKPGVANRTGPACMSASYSKDAPTWSERSLSMSSSGDATTGGKLFVEAVKEFLKAEVQRVGGDITYTAEDDSYVEAIVRGVRGWVIKRGRQWEKIQISVALIGGPTRRQVRITADGLLASGFVGTVPPDTKFTYSMEPEYSSQLTEFTKATLTRFLGMQGAR